MKMEIELTDSQLERVKSLESEGISVGEAIDMLFDIKEDISHNTNLLIDTKISKANKEKAELQNRLDKLDEEISLFSKLKDSTLDVEQKQKLVEKEYLETETFDKKVQDAKHDFKWSRAIFKI